MNRGQVQRRSWRQKSFCAKPTLPLPQTAHTWREPAAQPCSLPACHAPPVALHLLPAPSLELLPRRHHCRDTSRHEPEESDVTRAVGQCWRWAQSSRAQAGTSLALRPARRLLSMPQLRARAFCRESKRRTPWSHQNSAAAASSRKLLYRGKKAALTVVPPKLGQHAPQARPVGAVAPHVVHCSAARAGRGRAGGRGADVSNQHRRVRAGVQAGAAPRPAARARHGRGPCRSGTPPGLATGPCAAGQAPCRAQPLRPARCPLDTAGRTRAATCAGPDVQVGPLAAKDIHEALHLRVGGGWHGSAGGTAQVWVGVPRAELRLRGRAVPAGRLRCGSGCLGRSC